MFLILLALLIFSMGFIMGVIFSRSKSKRTKFKQVLPQYRTDEVLMGPNSGPVYGGVKKDYVMIGGMNYPV
jgi:hypothetical protein